jgi:poly(hydroxyalkanoate) depolymerase family esterase
MNDRLQAEMAEVMQFMRAGRLAEATAKIQRSLGIASPIDTYREASNQSKAEANVVDASPVSKETSVREADRSEAYAEPERPFPGVAPGILSHNALRLPGLPHIKQRGQPGKPEVDTSPPHTGAKFIDATFTNTAGTRHYKLYIPSGYTGQELPLIIMLHGCTQTAMDFAAGTRMNMLAEKELFFVAYPEQEHSANGSKCWNWFQGTHQQRGLGEPSLIAGITQQIMQTYHVDTNRVYITGMSAGGAMAAIMAATYPDLFAAVAVHSGIAYGAAHDLPSAFAAMSQGAHRQTRLLGEVIPLIVFHGDRDTTVAPINADCVLDQWIQAAHNGATSARRPVRDATVKRGQVTGGHDYTRFTYHDASGQVIVEKWVVHQAGHAWSGGSPNGSFTDPRGPNASAEIVRFFTEHPKRK